MAVIIQKRYDTDAAWTASNPILAIAEEGYVTDLGMSKIGDGVTDWVTLPFTSGGTSSGSSIDGGTASSVYLASQNIDGGNA